MGSSGSDVELDSSDGGDDEPPPSVDIPSSADEDEYEPPSDEDDDTVNSADDAESTAGDDPELESRLRDFLGAMPASRVASAAEDFVRAAFEDSPFPLEVQFRQAERAAAQEAQEGHLCAQCASCLQPCQPATYPGALQEAFCGQCKVIAMRSMPPMPTGTPPRSLVCNLQYGRVVHFVRHMLA